MELIHRAITSPIFELVGSYEIDLKLKSDEDEDQFSLRIELFRSLTDKELFRYKTWRNELFRIQSTFPQDNKGRSKHEPSDEMIMVGFSQPNFGPYGEFHAHGPEDALIQIAKDLGMLLEHVTAEVLTIKKS
jgi:hypothetical protein